MSEAEATDGGWARLMWVMVGIQFMMSLSFTILSPIMPLFLPDLGVHDPRAIDLWSGILNGVTPLVAAFASPLWGRMADRRGRKQALLRSTFAIGVFTALMGLSFTVWEFFAVRALMGAFAGFSAASIAMVATRVPEQRLGYALGWLSTGQLVGGLVGPVLGGGIADATGSLRVPFYATAGLTFVAFGLVVRLVTEQAVVSKEAARGQTFSATMALVVRSGGLLPLFFVLLFATFAVRTVQPVVTLFVQELTGGGAAVATLAGLAFSVTGVADVIASPFLGKRSDVIGYRKVLLISLAGAALTTLPQAFAGSYYAFLIERFGVGCFIGGILPTANALIGRMVPGAQRGTVYGMSASATFLGNSMGPLTGGGIAAAISIRFVFVVTAALLVATCIWVYFTVPEYTDAGGLQPPPRRFRRA